MANKLSNMTTNKQQAVKPTTTEQSSITSSTSNNVPYVLTFRDHHNAYTSKDGSGSTIEYRPCPDKKSSDQSIKQTINQTLFAIQQYTFSVVIVHYLIYWIPFALLSYLLILNGYAWIVIAMICVYLPSYVDRAEFKLGRAWNWFRMNPLWRFAHWYTDLEIVRRGKLDPKRRYIFAVHPHGIIIVSRIGLYGGTFEHLFPGVDTRTLGASPMFWVPFAREICLWMGAVDASKKTAKGILSQDSPQTGNPMSLFVYPGGSKEIFHTDPNTTVTTLIGRKGFIKLALEQGCDIVPMFVFGEKWMYRVWHPSKRVVDFFLRVLKTPVLVFWGRFASWLPFRSHMSLVFDTPIVINRKPDQPITDELIDEVYQVYIARIEALFNQYKTSYGYSQQETLHIIHEQKQA